MSATDTNPEFTAWKQKHVHRASLRMPLNLSSSASASGLLPFQQPSKQSQQRQQQQQPASPSLNEPSLPASSLNTYRLMKNSTAASPVLHDSSPPPPPLQQQEADGSSAEDIISPFLEALTSAERMDEKVRALDRDLYLAKRSLQRRLKGTTLQSPSIAGSPMVATPAEAEPALASSSSTSTSASSAAAQRAKPEDDEEDEDEEAEADQEDVPAASSQRRRDSAQKGPLSPTSSTTTTTTTTTATAASSSAATAATAAGAPPGPPAARAQSSDGEAAVASASPGAAPTLVVSPSSIASKPPSTPLTPSFMQQPTSPAPSSRQQQPEERGEARGEHVLLEQLRHDVWNCAREIERLVEDQYNLRCSVHNSLEEMSRMSTRRELELTEASQRGPAAAAPAASTPMSFVDSSTPSHAAHDEKTSSALASTDETSKHLAGSTDTPPPTASSAPSPWLLPYLEQLRQEQADQFQRLREETVVLICHAVAETRRTARLQTTSDETADMRANGRSPSPHKPVVLRNGDAVAVLPLSEAAQPSQQLPPASLLWQRYRRLLSPTPPHRSEVSAFTSASDVYTASSLEPSTMSVRGQDALWSTVLQMQDMLHAQSAQLARLEERLSLTAPPVAETKSAETPQLQQQHTRSSSRDLSRASQYSATTTTDTCSTAPSRVMTQTRTTTATSAMSTTTTTTPRHSVSSPKERHRASSRKTPHRHISAPVVPVDPSPRDHQREGHHHHHSPHRHHPQRADAKGRHRSRGTVGDEMTDLRRYLRDTLAHELHLQQQQQQQPHSQPHPYDPVVSSSRRSLHREAVRVDAAVREIADNSPLRRGETAPTPLTRGSLQTRVTSRVSEKPSSLTMQDTRYARGAEAASRPPTQHQQQPQQHPLSYPTRQRPMPPQAPFSSSRPLPVNREWEDEDVFADGLDEEDPAETENHSSGDTFRTPLQQLPQQRVRTTLRSALVYPPS